MSTRSTIFLGFPLHVFTDVRDDLVWITLETQTGDYRVALTVDPIMARQLGEALVRYLTDEVLATMRVSPLDDPNHTTQS